MIRKLATAAVIAAASLSYSAVAYADDFPATPMQHGAPTDLPGEKLIPGMSEAMAAINVAIPPIVLPPIVLPAITLPTLPQ